MSTNNREKIDISNFIGDTLKRILIIKYKCIILSTYSLQKVYYHQARTFPYYKKMQDDTQSAKMKLQNIHHDITFFFDKIKNIRIADESDANFVHHLTSNIWTIHTIKYE